MTKPGQPPQMNKYVYLFLVLVVAFAGAWLARPKVTGVFGGTDVAVFTGNSTGGETLIAAGNDTKFLSANVARRYVRICKTNTQNSQSQISFAIGSSASDGRGFILDSRAPCVVFTDPLVTGAMWAMASPSAASISYAEF